MTTTTPTRRSILLHGLRLVVTIPGPLLWTYALNLAFALIFSLRLHAQLSSILDHSLAAQRLNAAFDLGTILSVINRITYHAPDTGSSDSAGPILYLIAYFLLVPGTLFCYNANCPSRLSVLVSSGISFFWRFVRITLFTLLISGLILFPLTALANAWSSHVDNTMVGRPAFLATAAGWLVILLVAAVLRLYFDLVEVYTVQLADHYRPNGKPDRRVRRTLLPALRALRHNFVRAYGSFFFLTILGITVFVLTGRIAAHTLAQPRVWPQFLLLQLGLFVMMLTRFWQRGAETVLACENLLPKSAPAPTPQTLSDAIPDPEPSVPSLPQPDPGVFHHDAGTPPAG